MNFPTPETLNFALRSGDVVEVEAVRITTLDEDRGPLLRVEWGAKESAQRPGRILYGERWEGSRRSIGLLRELKPLHVWLLEVIP